MSIVQTLGDGNAVAIMPARKEPGPSRVPDTLPRGVDVLIARAVKHARDAIAHGDFRLDAHRGSLSARGGKSAIQDAPFGHMNFERPKPAIAPGDLPKKEIGHDHRNLSDGSGQG